MSNSIHLHNLSHLLEDLGIEYAGNILMNVHKVHSFTRYVLKK